MNVIVIVSDTFRRDHIGCNGNDWIGTPNIDEFSKRSVVFDRAYAGSFPTIPHRSDLFTGRYCFHTRGWSPLDPQEETFSKLLGKADYYSRMVIDTGNMLRGPMNFYEGFDEWGGSWKYREYLREPTEKDVEVPCSPDKFRFPERGRLVYPYLKNFSETDHFCVRTMREAAEWLEENHTREKFLLYVDTFDPHEPWLPPQEYIDLYDPGYEGKGEVVFFPRYDYSDYLTAAELKHSRALYAGMVTLVDKWIGFLLNKIDALGLFEEAAVIFTSDHGFYIGEHGRVGKHTVLDPKDGWPLYEEVNHIPLIMRIPDLPKGWRSDALVQPVDIMATILDLAGVQPSKDCHGRSVLPILRGEEERIREIAVSSGGPFGAALRSLNMKYPWVLSPDPEYVHHSTITDGDWTLLYATQGVHAELYDVRKDPKQENNLISENPETARRLHARFYDFLKSIGASEDILKLRREL